MSAKTQGEWRREAPLSLVVAMASAGAVIVEPQLSMKEVGDLPTPMHEAPTHLNTSLGARAFQALPTL